MTHTATWRIRKPEPVPHVGRAVEIFVDAGKLAADRHRLAVELRHHLESVLVGVVVADEDRRAAGKRRIGHQLAHRRALVEAGEFEFEHGLAEQQLDGLIAPGLVGMLDVMDECDALLGHLPVMQRQRIALVLDQHAGMAGGDVLEPLLEFGIERRRAPGDDRRRPRPAAFRRHARRSRRSCNGAKNSSISAIGRPLTSASAPSRRSRTRASVSGRSRRNDDLPRRGRDVEQRAIDIEQNGQTIKVTRV